MKNSGWWREAIGPSLKSKCTNCRGQRVARRLSLSLQQAPVLLLLPLLLLSVTLPLVDGHNLVRQRKSAKESQDHLYNFLPSLHTEYIEVECTVHSVDCLLGTET